MHLPAAFPERTAALENSPASGASYICEATRYRYVAHGAENEIHGMYVCAFYVLAFPTDLPVTSTFISF